MSSVQLSAVLRPLRALFQLVETNEQAIALDEDPWQFAICLTDFSATAITINDLQYLERQEWIEMRIETTKLSRRPRTFRRAPELRSRTRIAAVATPAGCATAASLARLAKGPASSILRHEPEQREIPRWDESAGLLWFRGQFVKRLSRRAAAQRFLLRVFEELGWPRHIDDPLPPIPGVVRNARLNNVIKKLNARHENRLIVFHGDGSGEGVLWEPYAERPQTGATSAPNRP